VAQALSIPDAPASARLAKRDSQIDVSLAATTLVVENMHCGNCMRTVENTLARLPGVESARTNLTAKRVAILTRGKPATADPFTDALANVGFKATVLAEPNEPSAKENSLDYLKRLGVAGFAAANIMLLSVSVWSGHASDMPASLQTMFHWLSALIALPAIAYAGQPFFAAARQALAGRRLNMDVPISLGVILATAMSLYQTVRGSGQVYFDAAITLLFFLLVGRALDQRMRSRAAGAAENLLGRRATSASVVRPDGTSERVAVSAIVPGMRVTIAAGEQIPVDGRITQGKVSVDESIVTGESTPRHVELGDVVHAGTIALTGPFEIEAIAAAENSLLAEIARLVQTAEQARGRYVRLADRAARLYAPMVHILGAATFAGWILAGAGWEPALTAAIAVLIITCPCALALAVPAVQVVASSRLFQNGIVLKSADALERLAEIDTVILDKTGTLTLGRPELSDGGGVPDVVLKTAASLAAQSRHPYAKAVVRAARARNLGVAISANVEEVAGAGLRSTIGGRRVCLGSAEFCGVAGAQASEQSLWFKEGDAPAIALPISDNVRPDAAEIVRRLVREGYAVEVLSGDNRSAVEEAARRLGIEHWYAAQRPGDKLVRIGKLEHEGRKVLMVGDGLNDAPALAAGHAALSPSSAADISQMAADAVFQGERLAPVIDLLGVAKAAQRRALENIAIAIGYNTLFVPLAMAGRVTPLIAAIAMSASSIAVTANALRLSMRTVRRPI
jgi:P-type Cu2+ transporter